MNQASIADSFDRQHRTALAVVVLLVLGNQALVQPYLMRLTTDAPLINVAGRQRMLSQRLAKAALIVECDRERERERAATARDEMRAVLDLWTTSHAWLLRDGSGTSAAVRAGLADLEPDFAALRDAARRLIAAQDGADLAVILDHEAAYLRKMDQVVSLYEREARDRIETFRRIGWGLTAATLAVLAALARFIFRPAAELIRRQVAELKRASAELEDRVRERTRELEAARERQRTLLEQLSHVGRTSTLGEMTSALAHELNQPLGAIANYAEGCLIALDVPEPDLDEVRAALERVRAVTMRAGRIIDRVRRFVTRHGPTRDSFEPNRLVSDTVEILGAEAQRRGVAVSLDLAPELPCLKGDPVQIQQVLVNLVRNALESLTTSQPSSPTVVIHTRPLTSGGVEFGVTDNGEGIPSDRLPRIFDAYFSTRAGGMGLGLAISRSIVEAHDGRFLVESEPGERTTFRFQLPADSPDHDDHERTDDLPRG